MHYFDWSTIPPNVLLSDELDTYKFYIASIIRNSLLDTDYVRKWYNYTDEWITKWLTLPDDEQYQEIDRVGWAVLSHARNPDKVHLYDDKDIEQIQTEYDMYMRLRLYVESHPGTIYKYTWCMHCRDIAPFLYKVCTLIDPSKEWVIIDDDTHSYVMQVGDKDTVYDILYSFYNIPIDTLEQAYSGANVYGSVDDFLDTKTTL